MLLQEKLMLAICTNVGLEYSTELVEAERLLLLSHAKEAAARCEMTRIDFDEHLPIPKSQLGSNASKSIEFSSSATLEIRRLECSLRPTDIFDMYHKFFYVCLCSYRNQVQATYAQEVKDEVEDGPIADEHLSNREKVRKVVFERLGLRFTGLHPNFQLKIEVFMLRLPQWFGGGSTVSAGRVSIDFIQISMHW